MKEVVFSRTCSTEGCDDATVFVVKLHRRDEPLLGMPSDALCHECTLDWLRVALNDMQEDEPAYGVTVMLP